MDRIHRRPRVTFVDHVEAVNVLAGLADNDADTGFGTRDLAQHEPGGFRFVFCA